MSRNPLRNPASHAGEPAFPLQNARGTQCEELPLSGPKPGEPSLGDAPVVAVRI